MESRTIVVTKVITMKKLNLLRSNLIPLVHCVVFNALIPSSKRSGVNFYKRH